MEIYYTSHVSPVKRKVLGDINNTADSPISPTANLKLLTKVASQCDSIENVNTTPTQKKESTRPNLEFNPQMKGNLRKFKSLGFLCDKFLKLFPLDAPECRDGLILLSDLARVLGVEKRRIYDIINVVESLQMATKIGKNSYSWSGRRKLADILSQLKAYAEQLGLSQYVRREQLKRKLYLRVKQEEVDSCDGGSFLQNSNIASFFRNERRIGILCQKFVMLFLVSLEGGLINLELAADVLVADDCQQNKTRLRRLYDIANILVSLGIITKVDCVGGGWKKPVFQYVGPPLHRMDNINYESSILSNLVKTELCDSVCSDLSEDSNEVSEELGNAVTVIEDHSYSLDVSAALPTPPPAKKRLVFNTDTTNNVVAPSNKQVVIQRTTDTTNNMVAPSNKQVVVQRTTDTTNMIAPSNKQVVVQRTTETTNNGILASNNQIVIQRMTDTNNAVVPSSKPLVIHRTTPVTITAPCTRLVRLVGPVGASQTITSGGLYKALRIGNNLHFIKVDNS